MCVEELSFFVVKSNTVTSSSTSSISGETHCDFEDIAGEKLWLLKSTALSVASDGGKDLGREVGHPHWIRQSHWPRALCHKISKGEQVIPLV